MVDALLDVRAGGPRVVILRGAAGCGKSRLAEWLTRRADEVGAAIVLRATHAPSPGSHDGVAAMLGRQLRTFGLSRDQAVGHLQQLLADLGEADPREALALADVVAPEVDPATPARARSSRERTVVSRSTSDA